MSVQDYYYPCNTSDDVMRAALHNDQEIFEIQSSRFYESMEKVSKSLNLGELFNKAFSASLGLSDCREIVRNMDRYQTLLTESLETCNNILTPLFLRSFQNHHRAFQSYTEEHCQTEAACASMAETGALAKEIAQTFDLLDKRFMSLREMVNETKLALVRDEIILYTKLRELEARKNTEGATPDICRKETALGSCISHLEKAQQALWDIGTAVITMHLFWKRAQWHCMHLEQPCLADPAMIRALELSKADNRGNDFVDEMLEAAKKLDDFFPQQKTKTSLSEVVASMRTGRVAPPREESELCKFISSIKVEDVAGEFKNSFLNWLTLAQINQLITSAIIDAIDEMQQHRLDVSQTEQDPLGIALQAAACSTPGQ